jgi:nitroreductase
VVELIEPLRLRRSSRAIDPERPTDDVLDSLWEAARLAPTQANIQPVRILLAESPAVHAAVKAALSRGNQGWAGDAPVLAAVAADPFQDMVNPNSDGTSRTYWAFHAGVATANLLAQATALGLIAHTVAGFDEPGVRAAFGAPETLRVLVVIAIGRPGALERLPADLQKRETAPQVRLPLDHVVVRDRWDSRHAISWRAYQDAHR